MVQAARRLHPLGRFPRRRAVESQGGTMASAVFCIVSTEAQAVRVVQDLRARGFGDEEISVLFHDKVGTRDFAHEHHTKTPEGAAVGAGTGGILGGVVGLLAGIGSLAIPGVGPLIAAGPLMATLGGAAVGAAVGGLTGALVGLGIPEYEAKIYEGRIRAGNILLSAHADTADRRRIAREVFENAGASDIASGSEKTAPDRAEESADRAEARASEPDRAKPAVAQEVTAMEYGATFPFDSTARVREIMTANPVALDASATIQDAACVMRDCSIGDVIVVKDGHVFGIVTDRDIVVRALANGDSRYPSILDTPLSEVATCEPCTLSPDDQVAQAITLMRDRAVRRLPVVHDGQPIGIVSLGDLALNRDSESVLGHISEAEPNN
jgi:CBS domain-containing protein